MRSAGGSVEAGIDSAGARVSAGAPGGAGADGRERAARGAGALQLGTGGGGVDRHVPGTGAAGAGERRGAGERQRFCTGFLTMTGETFETVVITGGAGAIGSRLVRRVLEDGARSVIVVDNFTSGYRWLLPDDERVTVVDLDVCDLLTARLPKVVNPVVFHLAAFFANQNSVDHPLDDLHTNAQGTLTTLLWARDNGAKRLVYASAGCSIAGHGLDVPIREDMPVSLHLDTPYQITKALGEFYCNYFDSSVSTVRCRFFNSYGPGEVPGPYRNVIPNFIWRAMDNEPLIITGTGEETRDFIF